MPQIPYKADFARKFSKNVCLVTSMVDISFQGAGMSRVRPEMEFSDQVDVVLKKSGWKILKIEGDTWG